MGIEIRPPAAPVNASGKAAMDDGRGRAQGASSRGEAPAVSFLSLLGSMGDGLSQGLPTDPGVSLTDAMPKDALATDGLLSQDVGATMAALQPDLVPAAAAAAVEGTSGLPAEQQPGVVRPGNPAPASHGASAKDRGADPGGQSASDLALMSAPAGHKDTRALQQAAAGADALQGQADKPAVPASARDFMSRIDAARTAAEAEAAAPRTSAVAMVASPSTTPPVASLFDVSAAGLRGGAPLRNQDRIQAKTPAPGAGAGFVAWGDATPAGTSHGASAVYAPGAMTPAPATAMAEKMHYWVSRGVQSAELQLDAFAGGSVDVSISVKGDSAMVEFRTDQPQARQLLLDAMPQLKDLLASEGLMLSGGFVGGSAQQGASSRDRDGQPSTAVRPAGGAGRTLESTGNSAAVTRATSGASVDLFV